MDKTMKLLVDFFDQREDLRLFCMNGSRVNSLIPDDKFKDYDVVFFTDDIKQYRENPEFLKIFGEILIMTEPEKDPLFPATFPEQDGYIYLVQYKNGVRIDFQFRTLAQIAGYWQEDTLTKVIKNKDQYETKSIVPNDCHYWLVTPNQGIIESSIKEFWWQFNNVLKATIRKEFLLAQFYLNITREELIRLMTWSVAIEEGFDRSYGKCHTQMLNYLPKEKYEALLSSYETTSAETIYRSLKQLQRLENQYMEKIAAYFSVNQTLINHCQSVPYHYLVSKDEKKLAEYFKE
ncbi:aminoglycoside 6-adenylyltransferase [Enterococcus sp. LJL99]